MAEAGTEKKMSLKILVDVKSKKVVCAEAGKDFVDFIFCIMSLSLSTVTKLLNEKDGMVGCLGALYKSIESLDAQYYEPNLNKDSVLNRGTSYFIPLLAHCVAAPNKNIRLYRCASHTNYVSDSRGLACPSCKCCMSSEFSLTYVSATTLEQYTSARFARGAVRYMVMDNLEVKPMSLSLIRSLVKDFDYMEEKEVEFGLQEGLVLLKASLETQAVLTTVFLTKKM